MQAAHGEDVEVVPVVVVTRSFPARPSAVPDVRDFVRQQLAQIPLPGDNIRALDRRVADVLLEAAGAGGTIQVSLRIAGSHAEVDILQSTQDEVVGDTGAVGAVPPPDGDRRPRRAPAGRPETAGASLNRGAAPDQSPAGGVQDRSALPFADWLADAIRREGMTLEAAARELKVSVKTVSRWVRGATEPRLHDLSRIREIFGELPFP
jgi:hypothetical protein